MTALQVEETGRNEFNKLAKTNAKKETVSFSRKRGQAQIKENSPF